MEGRSIKKEIHQELTYRDLDADIDHLWSLLFTTGYLTQCGEEDGGRTELVIPNREIHWIFVQQIRKWFKEEIKKNLSRLEGFCRAFQENNVAAIEEGFTAYLKKRSASMTLLFEKTEKRISTMVFCLGCSEIWRDGRSGRMLNREMVTAIS